MVFLQRVWQRWRVRFGLNIQLLLTMFATRGNEQAEIFRDESDYQRLLEQLPHLHR